MDYSASGENNEELNNEHQSTVTKQFKSQLNWVKQSHLDSQTVVPSEPGGAYSTPAPSNDSLTKINSSPQKSKTGVNRINSQPSELRNEK
jgi:hypothetical protein